MKRLLFLMICTFICVIHVEAHPGIGMVMDSKGNVFYTDLDQVWKISVDGSISIAVENVHTHELYIDESDNLYGEHEWYTGEATDTWKYYVWCLSQEGDLEQTIPTVEGYLPNNTLVRDGEGSTFWAEKSENHELLRKTTARGENLLLTNHLFEDIRWIYFSEADTTIYVIDHLKLKKVTMAGEVSILVDNLKESKNAFAEVADRHYAYGVWTDENATVFVALYGAGKVKKIGLNGELETILQAEDGWSISNGLISPDGSMWLMEFSKNNKTRIRKISPSGKQTVYKR